MRTETDLSAYNHHTEPSHTHAYLWPMLVRVLGKYPQSGPLFELGCGNGNTALALADMGYSVIAVDPSESGIKIAESQNSSVRFAQGSAYEDLASQYGQFDCVISLEVAEHLFYPRQYAQTVRALLKPGGIAIISTPYHGYWKNLALAATNKMDAHYAALWDFGHIKFWSRRTLRALFAEVQLEEIDFYRVGRVPILAKSMVTVFRCPATQK